MQTTNRQILAIGDLHGDHTALTATLHAHDIAPSDLAPLTKQQWLVIQTGDIFGHGPAGAEIVATLQRLKRRGMDVRILWGNHEIELMRAVCGDVRRFTKWMKKQGRREFTEILSEITKDNLELAHHYLTIFIRQHRAFFGGMHLVEHIGTALFLHAEPTPRLIHLIATQGVKKINRDFATAIKTAIKGDATRFLQLADIYQDAFMSRHISGIGRKNIRLLTAPELFEMTELLKQMGITTVVHGHTSQKDGISRRLSINGVTIINNDIALSQFKNRIASRSGGVVISMNG